VAAATVKAEFAVMYVIGAVAAAAGSVDGFYLVQRHAMAIVTGDVCVRTVEYKFRLGIVIKGPDFPGDRVVAGVARVIEMTVVRVIFRMARGAIGFYVSKDLGFVATVANRLLVRAQSREASQVMIEKYRLLPLDLVMAVVALRAQRALVRFIVEVTGAAFLGQFDLVYRLDVAVVASDCSVRTEQLIFRIARMIKLRFGP